MGKNQLTSKLITIIHVYNSMKLSCSAKYLLSMLIFFIVLSIFSSPVMGNSTNYNRNKEVTIKEKIVDHTLSPSALTPTQEYKNSDPIHIDGNEELMSYGFEGDGSRENPFLIEGFSISTYSDDKIRLVNTRLHILIKNNYVDGLHGTEGFGVILDNSSNVIIRNNIITRSAQDGIVLYFSSNNKVIENQILENAWNGIRIEAFSDNNLVERNFISDSGGGINILDTSNKNIVQSNTITGIQGNGISLGRDSPDFNVPNSYNIISGNAISNGGADGIALAISDYTQITNNTINNNQGIGIVMFGARFTTISRNDIFANVGAIQSHQDDDTGLFSEYNFIDHNNITAERNEGMWHGFSKHYVITNNRIIGNELDGITLFNCENFTISGNHFIENFSFGLSIQAGSNHNITWNYFVDNNGLPQLSIDPLTPSIEISYNYWSDFTGQDADADGIFDTAFGNDNFPLASLEIVNPIHEISKINFLLVPENIFDRFEILVWKIPIDSQGHRFQFSLYYSEDQGVTWNILEISQNSHYIWDANSFYHKDYVVKVVATASNGLSIESDYRIIENRKRVLFTFEALIDGKDELILQGEQIWYHHYYAQLPGKFNEENVSTVIDNHEWFPEFPMGEDEGDSTTVGELIKLDKMRVEFIIENIKIQDYDPNEDPGVQRSSNLVYISQQPLEENDFTLKVMLDDEGPNGAAWYAFSVVYTLERFSQYSENIISDGISVSSEVIITSIEITSDAFTYDYLTSTFEDDDPIDLGIIIGLIVLGIGVFGFVKFANRFSHPKQIVKPSIRTHVDKDSVTSPLDKTELSMQPLFCGTCGTKSELDSLFCGNCGVKFDL
ncbi:MAG: right-handed parallel beta-helix repeat-containing protein [Candidatus Heimdallarchaeota archaeon]|nr:right-handed parallel beta-helix repeat-containing protein [Candidatus Heimdallarchaeota archaeon]